MSLSRHVGRRAARSVSFQTPLSIESTKDFDDGYGEFVALPIIMVSGQDDRVGGGVSVGVSAGASSSSSGPSRKRMKIIHEVSDEYPQWSERMGEMGYPHSPSLSIIASPSSASASSSSSSLITPTSSSSSSSSTMAHWNTENSTIDYDVPSISSKSPDCPGAVERFFMGQREEVPMEIDSGGAIGIVGGTLGPAPPTTPDIDSSACGSCQHNQHQHHNSGRANNINNINNNNGTGNGTGTGVRPSGRGRSLSCPVGPGHHQHHHPGGFVLLYVS